MSNKLTEEEKEEWAVKNLKLIHFIANKHLSSGIEYDELFSAAQYAFVKALNSFSKDAGYKFSTYCARCMTNEIFQLIKRKNAMKRKAVMLSLDSSTFDDERELHQLIAKNQDHSIEYDWHGLNEAVNTVLSKAKPKTRDIFHMYLSGFSQPEIASKYQCTHQNIHQIEKAVITKIKKEYAEFDAASV